MTSASDKPSAIAEIGDMNRNRFSDLVDVPALARVLESIFRVTGIPNAVVDASGELSFLMLDVDHFKQVNDTYGHKVGDLVLIKLSELCRASLRDVDVIGRIGGEEFAVLLPETGNEQAMEAAESLRAEIASAQVTPGSGLPLRFTASFGLTTLRDKEANIDMLLNQADQALYQAKNAGRNRVRVYPVNDERGT